MANQTTCLKYGAPLTGDARGGFCPKCLFAQASESDPIPVAAPRESAANLSDSAAEPYRRTLPPLLDGTHDSDVLASYMPGDMFKILRADFQADFRTNSNNSLRRALSDNNVYNWTPQAPIKMFHCRGDRDVIFANAEVAYQSFTNRGACCVEVVDPGAPQMLDHGGCYIPSLRAVMTWFETLKP